MPSLDIRKTISGFLGNNCQTVCYTEKATNAWHAKEHKKQTIPTINPDDRQLVRLGVVRDDADSAQHVFGYDLSLKYTAVLAHLESPSWPLPY